MIRSLALALAALLMLGDAPAPASLPTVTVVETTRTTSDWPLQVAEKLGYFAPLGIKVDVIIAGSSAGVAQQIAAGAAEVGTVSTVQGVVAIMGGAPFVEVLRNAVTTPYYLVGRKGLTSLAQLKGKTVIIGGASDITRFLTDPILRAAHLGPDDVTYVYAGATNARYAALLNGGVDAAIVQPPTSFLAAASGYPLLADVEHYFPTLPMTGYAARLPWVKSHPEQLVAFLTGFLEGVRWLYQPANRAQAIQIFAEDTNSTPEDSRQSYDLYISHRLFVPNGRFAPADFAQVVNMLVSAKQIAAPAPPATTFYDNTWVDAAYKKVPRR